MSRNSDNFEGSFGDSIKDADEDKSFQIYGMHFCDVCRNMMIPNKEQGEKLEFICRQCDKKEVDFSKLRNQECVIYNKELRPGTTPLIARSPSHRNR